MSQSGEFYFDKRPREDLFLCLLTISIALPSKYAYSVQSCSFGSEPLDGGEERKENFKKVLGILLEPDGSPRVFRPGDTATATSTPPGSTPAPILSSDYVEEDELAGDTAEEEEDWTDDELASDTDAEEEDWAEEEEEDWSESSTGTSAMSLWCGESQESAYENCYREGYDCPDGVCFNGLKCFMVGNACEEGEGAGISAQIDISPSPSPATEFEATGNNIGVLGQFCAETFDSLEIVCATATTCVVPEDCPSGTYCWKEFMCGGTVSPSIAAAPQSTYSYSPSILDTSLSSNTLTNSQSANDVAATYPPSPSPTPGFGSSGPQSTGAVQQLFCASTMEELEMSCATAQSCISGPCPSKMFCFPFTCTETAEDGNSLTSTAPAENQLSQNQLQCPQSTFVGWHTSTDCKGE